MKQPLIEPAPRESDGQHVARPDGANNILLEVARQFIAAEELDEVVSLAIEAVTARLGHGAAAVAYIDHRTGDLKMRAAVGLAGEPGLSLGARAASFISDVRPRWLRRGGSADEAVILARFQCHTDLLALPLLPPDAAASVGVLFVGADHERMSANAYDALLNLAGLLGAAVASALRREHLVRRIEERERERDQLGLIIEHVGHPVAVRDAGGDFVLFNRRAEYLFRQEESPADANRAARAARDNADKLAACVSEFTSGAAGRQDEIELLDPASGEVLPMEVTSVEVANDAGAVTAVVSILHDVSEIRELERRRVEQQLFESEKLAAVGRLAASIAHEVNNPLEAIKNSLYLLSTTPEGGESNARFLDLARKETERVSHIIRQMLGFARRTGRAEWAQINQLLDETLILTEKKLRQSGVRVVREFDAGLPPVRARVDQLRQVFLNLILNAQQAIDGEGTITVTTARYGAALQPSVSVRIADTGRGIPEAERTHIFEPFFSTRSKGTGIGLWVTQDIVRHHGGRIEVRSEPGRGTIFDIILPVDSPTLGKEEIETH